MMKIAKLNVRIVQVSGGLKILIDPEERFSVSSYGKLKLEAVVESFQERVISDEMITQMREAIAAMILGLAKQGHLRPRVQHDIPKMSLADAIEIAEEVSAKEREKAALKIKAFLDESLPWLSEKPYNVYYCDPVEWFQSQLIERTFTEGAIAVMIVDETPLYTVIKNQDSRLRGVFLTWLGDHYIYEIVNDRAILLISEA